MLQKDKKLTKNERDLKRRKDVLKNEKKRRALEIVIHNLQLPDYIRAHAFRKLQKLPRNSSAVRLTNRCVETGRSKGIVRDFKLSRIKLRELAQYGLLPGLRKASW